jgi:Spy/CpxP family protein refolding chaperone
MGIKRYALFILMIAVTTASVAQGLGGGGQGGGHKRRGAPELMAENLFSPDLVMQNQKALNLTESQQSAIRAEMQKTMATFTDLKWQESAASEALDAALKVERPDEKQALALFDKVLAAEDAVKRLQFGMLVRVKNLLTPQQQTLLKELKEQEGPDDPPRERGQGGAGGASKGGRPNP